MLHKKDMWSGIGTMVISLGFIIGALFMPWEEFGIQWYGSPGLLPVILGSFLFLSGLMLFIRAVGNSRFYQRLEEEKAKDKILEPEKSIINDERVKSLPFYLQSEKYRMLIVIGLCALYVFVLIGLKLNLFGLHIKLHYTTATAIYVAAFIWIFKGGNWLKSILVGVISSVTVWLLFEKVFLVFLP